MATRHLEITYKAWRFLDILTYWNPEWLTTSAQMLIKPVVFLIFQCSRVPNSGLPAAWPAGRPAMLIDEKIVDSTNRLIMKMHKRSFSQRERNRFPKNCFEEQFVKTISFSKLPELDDERKIFISKLSAPFYIHSHCFPTKFHNFDTLFQ